MEFRLLGPVELEGKRGIVPLGSAKQRAVLAVLLINANELVSHERLIDELWGDDPPASAAHGVDAYVSRLRKALHDAGGDGLLATRGGSYVLDVDATHYDVARFEQLVDEARAGDPERAASLLRDALALWRGPPLADVSLPGPAAGVFVDRLEELRLFALEERFEADLALGRHTAVVGEVQGVVSEHPLRERLRMLHMRALYGAGRQADALESYAEGRRALRELGLEPSKQLNDLQRRILMHDPSLDARVEPAGPAPRGRGRRAWIAAAAVLVTAAATAFAVALTHGRGTEPDVAAANNSVGLFDPISHRIVADLPIGGSPNDGRGGGGPGIAVGLGSVWVCDSGDGTLVRVDPRTRRIARTIGLGKTPAGVAVGHGAVWVVVMPPTELIELDPLGNIVRRIPLSRRDLPAGGGPASVASGPGGIWVLHGLASVAKIDPRTGKILHDTVGLGGVLPGWILATDDGVWVTGLDQGLLVRVDPATGALRGKTPSAGGPNSFWWQLARGPDGLWVSDSQDDLVWRIDPIANRPNGSVAVDHEPRGIAAYGGAVWVTGYLAGTIDEVDPGAMRVVRRTMVGLHPSDLAVGPGGLWVTFGG